MPSDETVPSDRGEWASMLGMAGMFVGTILLGLVIRPFYDANQLQAFGESGATQVRYVALELVMIFIFTAAILFLVRMGARWVIKYGVMAILALALMYTTVPLAHVLLVDDPGVLPFESEATSRPDGRIVGEFGPDHAVFVDLEYNDGTWVTKDHALGWTLAVPKAWPLAFRPRGNCLRRLAARISALTR